MARKRGPGGRFVKSSSGKKSAGAKPARAKPGTERKADPWSLRGRRKLLR